MGLDVGIVFEGLVNDAPVKGAHRLKLHDIVRDAERSMHRRARPFSLRIDFVCWPRYDPNDQMYRGWPQDYRRLAAEDHLVLGISYLETARLDDLRAIVQMQVARLV